MESKSRVAKASTMMFDNEDYLLKITKEVVELLCNSELRIDMAKAILKDALITIEGISNNQKLEFNQ